MEVRLSLNGSEYKTIREGSGRITVPVSAEESVELHVRRMPGGGFTVETPEGWKPAEAVRNGDTIWVRFEGRTYRFEVERGRARKRSRGAGDLSSPMPGQVQKVLVSAGDTVEAHQALLVVEAMKMQLEIKAPHDGVVKKLLAAEGDQVDAGVPLAEVEAAS